MPLGMADLKDYCNSIAEPMAYLNNTMEACVNCTDVGCKYCVTSLGSFCTIANDFEGQCDEFYDPDGTMYSYTGKGVCDGFDDDGDNVFEILMFALVLPCGLTLCMLGVIGCLHYNDKIRYFSSRFLSYLPCYRRRVNTPDIKEDIL